MPVPFSVRLDQATRKRLEEEARRLDRPASQVAARAIAGFLDAQDEFRRQVDAAVEEAEKGVFISSDAMYAWMDSWGSDREQAPPAPDIQPTGSASASGSSETN